MSVEIPANAGMESLDHEDPSTLRIPYRSIIQPSTKLKDLGIKAAPGSFLDKEAKAVFESMDVVILRSTKSRLLMPPFGSKDNKPRCFSEDGVRPSERVDHPLSPTGLCRDCEFAREDDQTNLLMYDVQTSKMTGFPHVFWFTAKKSSLGITRQFLDTFRKQGKRPADYIVTVTAEAGKSDKGNFFVVKYGNLEEVPSNMKDDIAVAYHMYVGETHKAEEVATASTEEPPF